jgi:hypothetical protein
MCVAPAETAERPSEDPVSLRETVPAGSLSPPRFGHGSGGDREREEREVNRLYIQHVVDEVIFGRNSTGYAFPLSESFTLDSLLWRTSEVFDRSARQPSTTPFLDSSVCRALCLDAPSSPEP